MEKTSNLQRPTFNLQPIPPTSPIPDRKSQIPNRRSATKWPTYTWDTLGRIASVKSLAGTFRYEYDAKNPALLTRMIGPVHRVDTTYEPKRNLIAEVKNVALVGIGSRNEDRGSSPASVADTNASSPVPHNPNKSSLLDSDAAIDARISGSLDPKSSILDPSAISRYTYENDSLGRRTRIHMSGAAFDRYSAPQTVDIAYNDRSEVIGATYTERQEGDRINQIHRNYGYQYDAIGNRQKASVETLEEKTETTYTANALNQYTQIQEKKSIQKNPENPVNPVQKNQSKKNPENPVHPVQNHLENPVHDPDGNLLTDGRYRYQWDAENRLIAAISLDPAALHRIEYGYDHQSRRVLRREYNATEGGALTGEIAYLYDDWNVIAELPLDPKSSILDPKLMTWGRDLSGSLQEAGGVGGLFAITEASSKSGARAGTDARDSHSSLLISHYFLYDANGNVTQMLDSAGALVAQYEYDPFGNATTIEGAHATVNPCRFSTKPEDGATGMLYYGYRHFLPETGRWLNRDPVSNVEFEIASITLNNGTSEKERMRVCENLYCFVRNRPSEYVDRLGLSIIADFLKNLDCKCCASSGGAATLSLLDELGVDHDSSASNFAGGNAMRHCVAACKTVNLCG